MTRRHRTLGYLATVGVGGVLVTMVVAAVRSGAEPSAAPRRAGLPVEVLVARHQPDYETSRAFTGEVAARRTSDLGFELGGRIVSFTVDDGDVVTAGQALARLDTRRLTAERARLQAQRDQADALLREREAGPRVETIAAARAIVAERSADAALALRKVRKVEALFADGRASEEELDDTRSVEQVARARLDQARQRLNELEAGTRAELIDAQRAMVAQLDAAVAALDVDLQHSVLRAPFDGRIGRRSADEGTVVPAGQPVLRLVEDGRMEARFGVTPAVRDRLPVGTAVTLIGVEPALAGRIHRHLPEIDPLTRTATVIVELDAESSARVQPGRVVRLPVTTRVAQSGMWLPTTALVRAEMGLWSCYVLEDDAAGGPPRARRVAIEVLHAATERAYVRGLVNDGDRVIAAGVQRIVPGQRVHVAANGE